MRLDVDDPLSESACASEVAPRDAQGDREWFANRPNRLFRARTGDEGVWLILRRRQTEGSDVCLRTFSRAIELPSDNDAAIAISWYRTAWPDKPPDEVRKCMAKALRGGAP